MTSTIREPADIEPPAWPDVSVADDEESGADAMLDRLMQGDRADGGW